MTGEFDIGSCHGSKLPLLLATPDDQKPASRHLVESSYDQVHTFVRNQVGRYDVIVVLFFKKWHVINLDRRKDNFGLSAIDLTNPLANIGGIGDDHVWPERSTNIPDTHAMKHPAKQKALRAKSKVGLVEIFELLIPRVSNGAMYVTQ